MCFISYILYILVVNFNFGSILNISSSLKMLVVVNFVHIIISILKLECTKLSMLVAILFPYKG